MAFVVTTRVPLESFPELDAVLSALRPVVGRTLRTDAETQAASRRGRPESSWCPWPRTSVGFYVPGASTRGAEVGLTRSGTGIEIKVVQPVLGTWTDWCLAIELAAHLAESAGAPVRLDPTTAMAPAEFRARFIADDRRWIAECTAGAEAVRNAVAAGRIVRLGGPAGMASIGPRTWSRLDGHDDDEVPADELIHAIQRSVEARGFETYYPANLLCLDGRSGREVITSLLAKEVATILRDPEYVLLGDDLEDRSGPTLYLLRFDDIDDALPGRVIWIDDRACAIAPISSAEWPELLRSMKPWLSPVEDLLDAGAGVPGMSPGAWRSHIPPEEEPSPPQPEPRAPAPDDRPWWKFW